MVSPLQPIETRRLYQKIADQIAGLIREGHWMAGARLPSEREMAVQMAVSRPVVREAMIALELQGLVEIRTGAGIYVTGIMGETSVWVVDSEDPGPSPFELIAARRVIEGETTAIAAEQADQAIISDIYNAILKMEEDIEKGEQLVSEREDGDRVFHSRIAAASGNSVLVSIVEQLWEGMRRPIFKAICERARLPENARRAAREHRAIYDRIIRGDSEGARNEMQAHLDQVSRVLLRNGDFAL